MWANCRVLSVCPLLCACFLSVGAVTVHLARFPYEGVYAYIDIWHTLLCFLLMDIFHIKNRLIFSGRSTIKNESNQLLGGGGERNGGRPDPPWTSKSKGRGLGYGLDFWKGKPVADHCLPESWYLGDIKAKSSLLSQVHSRLNTNDHY